MVVLDGVHWAWPVGAHWVVLCCWSALGRALLWCAVGAHWVGLCFGVLLERTGSCSALMGSWSVLGRAVLCCWCAQDRDGWSALGGAGWSALGRAGLCWMEWMASSGYPRNYQGLVVPSLAMTAWIFWHFPGNAVRRGSQLVQMQGSLQHVASGHDSLQQEASTMEHFCIAASSMWQSFRFRGQLAYQGNRTTSHPYEWRY